MNTKYLIAIPSMALALCAYTAPLPFELSGLDNTAPQIEGGITMKTPSTPNTNTEWESNGSLHYKINSENALISYQINILNDLVSTMIEKSEDLDPKFSSVVDKYFWDLA